MLNSILAMRARNGTSCGESPPSSSFPPRQMDEEAGEGNQYPSCSSTLRRSVSKSYSLNEMRHAEMGLSDLGSSFSSTRDSNLPDGQMFSESETTEVMPFHRSYSGPSNSPPSIHPSSSIHSLSSSSASDMFSADPLTACTSSSSSPRSLSSSSQEVRFYSWVKRESEYCDHLSNLIALFEALVEAFPPTIINQLHAQLDEGDSVDGGKRIRRKSRSHRRASIDDSKMNRKSSFSSIRPGIERLSIQKKKLVMSLSLPGTPTKTKKSFFHDLQMDRYMENHYAIARGLSQRVEICSRKHLRWSHPNCFLGKDAVSCLVQDKHATNMVEAKRLLENLEESGMITKLDSGADATKQYYEFSATYFPSLSVVSPDLSSSGASSSTPSSTGPLSPAVDPPSCSGLSRNKNFHRRSSSRYAVFSNTFG